MTGQKKTYFLIFGITILLTFLVVSSELVSFNFPINKFYYLISSVLLVLFILLVIKNSRMLNIYIILGCLGSIYILVTPYFSPIDEGAHFDYIMHIVRNHRLPNLFDQINTNILNEVTKFSVPSNLQYEAVHPPLYYLLSAIIVYPFKSNLVVGFFILRFTGLGMMLLTLYFIVKSYEKIVIRKIVCKNDHVFKLIVLVVFMSPGFTTRMLTLNNEQLVVLLSSVLFYFLTKYDALYIGLKQTFVLSVVSALMILTKFTSLYIVGIIIVYLIICKKYKHIFLYLGTVALIISPWLFYNLFLYGSLTGTHLHVEFVKQIVNPNGVKLGFFYIINSFIRFMVSFWIPQEILNNLDQSTYFLVGILNFFLVYSVVFGMFHAFRNKERIVLLSLLSIVLNVGILVYGTYTQSIDIMIGRYMYISLFPIVTVLYMLFTSIRFRTSIIQMFLIFIACFCSVNYIFSEIQLDGNVINRVAAYNIKKQMNFSNYQQEEFSKILRDEGNLDDIPLLIGKTYSERKDANENSYKLSGFHNVVSFGNGKFKVSQKDPFIVFTLKEAIKPTKENYLVIKVGNSGLKEGSTAQLFWDNNDGFSEFNSVKYNIASQKVIVIPLGKLKKWEYSSRISSLRLDLDNANEEIKEFNLELIEFKLF
jgi:hypothetical protein